MEVNDAPELLFSHILQNIFYVCPAKQKHS